MRVKLFFSGQVVVASTSDEPHYWIQATVHCEGSETWWRKNHGMGCFSYYGVGPIYRIPGIMDLFEYINILEEIMLLYAEVEMPLKCVF